MTTRQGGAPRVSALVLSHGPEPWLEPCVHALLASTGIDVEVVLVDNGCTDGAVERLRGVPGVVHVGKGENIGYSAGNNLGALNATGDYLALVNGDFVARPDMLEQLVARASDPRNAVVGASVRLANDPELLNSDGNTIHFLGFSWCGDFGEPAADHMVEQEVASIMGAAAMLRREVWDELGGFEENYFAFHEDVDLCWRARSRGYRIVHVPDAVGVHRYEFDRVGHKMFLVERNRLMFVLTCFERTTLSLLAPALIAMELAVTAAAIKQGWLRQKVDGWRWLWTHRRWLGDRRRTVQTARTERDSFIAPFYADRLLASNNFALPATLEPLDRALAWYWHVVRRFLPRSPTRTRGTSSR
jgi:GT2 family glycosyltransferase